MGGKNPHPEKNGQTGPKGITEERIMEALSKNAGVLLAAAHALNCSTRNLRQRIKNSTALLTFMEEIEDDELDIAEGAVRKGLRKGDLPTARWYLDRKGHRRGYRARAELTGPNGAPIQLASTSQSLEPPITPEELALARSRFINPSDD